MRNWDAGRLSDSVVTFTFLNFSSWKKLWAMQYVESAKRPMKLLPGLRFFKLFRCGDGNCLHFKSDHSTYGFLAVWSEVNAAQNFFERAHLFQQLKKRSNEYWTVYMQTTAVHGRWYGTVPFSVGDTEDKDSVVGIITHTLIQPKYLWHVWRNVPRLSPSTDVHPGMLFSQTMDETPLVGQANFSLWKSHRSLMDYAKRSRFHREVTMKIRENGWFEEELFAQFKPFYSEGTWQGDDLLQKYLIRDYAQILQQSL
jgi:hypothetical protein